MGSYEAINYTETCLSFDTSTFSVQLETCDGSAQQKFSYELDNTVKGMSHHERRVTFVSAPRSIAQSI